MTNPLLQPTKYPAFDKIQPNHVEEAIDHWLAYGRDQLEAITTQRDGAITWDNTLAILEEANDHLYQAWSAVNHLNAVASTPALRDAHQACLPKLSAYNTALGQHKGLFKCYQQLLAQDDTLSIAQQACIKQALRDFHLSGIALTDEAREQFNALSSELATLTNQFENNLMDATDAWSYDATLEALDGLPERHLSAARTLAKTQEKTGYTLSLDPPCYLAVMQHGKNRALRKTVYTAYVTRSAEQGDPKQDNTAVMVQILKKRLQLAKHLGFDQYADYSLATKMVTSADAVLVFLRDLAARAKPQAEKEWQTLQAFARQQDKLETVEAWDVAFYSERLREIQYDFSQEALRPYFPINQVLNGLFQLVERLYGVHSEEQTDPITWHPDVRLFSLYNNQKELIAHCYLDLYARPKKRGGAWMDECQVRRRGREGNLQLPIAYLTCNFMPPTQEKPALLTHDDVVCLFHEFGHGLHHMLTKVECAAVSGINGVPWDAVELPSQFHEQWCWQPEILKTLASHYETKAPLPEPYLEKLIATRHFQSAMAMVRQIEFALFDSLIHQVTDPTTLDADFIQATLNIVRREVAVINYPAFNRFQHGFSHIFAGGYAAGYYSYHWAEVLASDAFARFEEEGLFNPTVSQAFLQTILERGGTEDPKILFEQFRNRAPKIDALLQHRGIETTE